MGTSQSHRSTPQAKKHSRDTLTGHPPGRTAATGNYGSNTTEHFNSLQLPQVSAMTAGLPQLTPGSELAQQYQETMRTSLEFMEKAQSGKLKPREHQKEFQKAHQASTAWVRAYYDAMSAQSRENSLETAPEDQATMHVQQVTGQSQLSDGAEPPSYKEVMGLSHTDSRSTDVHPHMMMAQQNTASPCTVAEEEKKGESQEEHYQPQQHCEPSAPPLQVSPTCN